ncbi:MULTISPECIES: hypothetical protein [Chromohalobacter]|uniref:S-adenosylmethionine decarboxylase n=1 Tax=Chromohalobacter canadensis TaxID=141389 RepID=A0ABZ0Y9D1_9GAMM|nr:hypothetical protein [Chromohalobacter canadensis]MCK0767942.1 hypothetical protein [Chromohalobacter canadensis]WQH08511.1 hypothetical protein SR908_13640 [Chromohalobacter canadensis]
MRTIHVDVAGVDHECDENEAVEMFLSLKEGLEDAGVKTEKLSTIPRPNGSQVFHRHPLGVAIAMTHLTDC